MGSDKGDGGSESTPVTMEYLKNLETRLSSSLVNEVKKMLEQLLKDKEGSSPPSPQEDQPSILPKGNTSVSPEGAMVGVNPTTLIPPHTIMVGRVSTVTHGTLPTLQSLTLMYTIEVTHLSLKNLLLLLNGNH